VLRILNEVTQQTFSNCTEKSFYGDSNNAYDIDNRARHVIFKSGLTSTIFWKIPLALFANNYRPVIAAPKGWRIQFRKLGVNIAPIRSAIAWNIRQWKFLLSALRTLVRLTRFSWHHRDLVPEQPYWIADRFPANSYASSNQNKTEHLLVPFVDDFLHQKEPRHNIWAVLAGCQPEKADIGYVVSPEIFPPLPGKILTLSFLTRGILKICSSFLRWLLGANYAPSLATDVIELEYFKRLPQSRLPKRYIVTHSGCGARPLWVSEAENRGVESSMIFYSTNNRILQKNNDSMSPLANPEHLFLNWGRYLVYDRYQADWVKSFSKQAPNVIELGNLPFEDNGKPLPDIPDKSIAVFDITPVRPSFFALDGERGGFLTDQYVTTFLSDISQIIKELDMHMIIKQKRERTSNIIGRRYRTFVAQLSNEPHCLVVDSGIAAAKVIEKSSASISIPLTSTGHRAAVTKPSIYYNPFGQLYISMDQSHGVPVLHGRQELKNWLGSHTQ
jgi:hypothetical protein